MSIIIFLKFVKLYAQQYLDLVSQNPQVNYSYKNC